jgi:hypothetical protein
MNDGTRNLKQGDRDKNLEFKNVEIMKMGSPLPDT